MAAHREQALRDREIAVAERALGDRFMGQMRFQFAPKRDPLEQGAGDVEPREPKRERRVHVEVAIDERRRKKISARVDDPTSLGFDPWLDSCDTAGGDRNVLALATVRQGRIAQNCIKRHGASGLDSVTADPSATTLA